MDLQFMSAGRRRITQTW